MRQLAIIDYGSGNLHSVQQSVCRVADAQSDEWQVITTSNASDLSNSDAIILPGVGHFKHCRENLEQLQDMEQALINRVEHMAVPFLGICVGMQLMATTGHEGKPMAGLDWIAGEVHPLKPTKDNKERALKIPHMGWNQVSFTQSSHPITANLTDNQYFYFVHSFHFIPTHNINCIAITEYGQSVTAMIAKDNKIGTQFHPEKSQKAGLNLLAGFMQWRA